MEPCLGSNSYGRLPLSTRHAREPPSDPEHGGCTATLLHLHVCMCTACRLPLPFNAPSPPSVPSQALPAVVSATPSLATREARWRESGIFATPRRLRTTVVPDLLPSLRVSLAVPASGRASGLLAVARQPVGAAAAAAHDRDRRCVPSSNQPSPIAASRCVAGQFSGSLGESLLRDGQMGAVGGTHAEVARRKGFAPLGSCSAQSQLMFGVFWNESTRQSHARCLVRDAPWPHR